MRDNGEYFWHSDDPIGHVLALEQYMDKCNVQACEGRDVQEPVPEQWRSGHLTT